MHFHVFFFNPIYALCQTIVSKISLGSCHLSTQNLSGLSIVTGSRVDTRPCLTLLTMRVSSSLQKPPALAKADQSLTCPCTWHCPWKPFSVLFLRLMSHPKPLSSVLLPLVYNVAKAQAQGRRALTVVTALRFTVVQPWAWFQA